MHHCLQIQELLSIIFRKYTQYDSGLLARLARTCIAFQDPALNILWHTQKTLLPLLKCLPPDAWAIKEYKFVSHISQDIKACFSYRTQLSLQGIIRNLTSSDFERIYFYCHRIRILGRFASRPLSQYFEAQVLPIIWSRKPSLGPLLSNMSEVNLVDGSFPWSCHLSSPCNWPECHRNRIRRGCAAGALVHSLWCQEIELQ
jgi:hypothetical protein